jgi:peptidoglycan/LPS O-acetylase OafA/YrhL
MVETLAALPIIYVVYYVDEGPLQWFCTLRFVRFLGRISYSLYILSALLIHGIGSVMLLTIPASFITAHGLLMNVMAAAVLFSLACLLGRLTFHFIEQPFMAYGHRVNAIVHSKVDQI